MKKRRITNRERQGLLTLELQRVLAMCRVFELKPPDFRPRNQDLMGPKEGYVEVDRCESGSVRRDGISVGPTNACGIDC